MTTTDTRTDGRRSQPVTIFEGPDGAGKTTLARAYAAATGARYVHLGPFPLVTRGLGRLYAEAIMPAVLGYQSVVLDRCWVSEVPYGQAFRGGADRLGVAGRRMLDRLLWRCGPAYVSCLPSRETCLAAWQARKGDEYLTHADQLLAVWEWYDHVRHPALALQYDYTTMTIDRAIEMLQGVVRAPAHPVGCASAGHAGARVLLVGEAFAEPKDHDPLNQWPFASFSRAGCSAWLTQQLEAAGISEHELCWVNADQIDWLYPAILDGKKIVALGTETARRIDGSTLARYDCVVYHPQAWARFHVAEPYPLIPILRGLL